MKICHKILNPDGNYQKEDKILTINVKPGWKSGTKITFNKEGDQHKGRIPADIIFILREKPNNFFKRDGNDLRFTASVSLKQALCGCVLSIPNIHGEFFNYKTIGEIIKPNTMKRFEGKGLPITKEPNKKGDLIVDFHIVFPSTITHQMQEALLYYLPD